VSGIVNTRNSWRHIVILYTKPAMVQRRRMVGTPVCNKQLRNVLQTADREGGGVSSLTAACRRDRLVCKRRREWHVTLWEIPEPGGQQDSLLKYIRKALFWNIAKIFESLISGLRRDVDEICAVLGYYPASCGNCLPTYRDNVSVPSSRVK
jgi:hypothetical protein